MRKQGIRQFHMNRSPPPSQEQGILDSLRQELRSSQKAPSVKIVASFAKALEALEASKISIKGAVKIGLEEGYKSVFETCSDEGLVRRLVSLILRDLAKERNRNSNPSLFLKFLGFQNLALLSDQLLEQVSVFLIGRLNKYISCDKNVFYVFYRMLRNNVQLKQKTKLLILNAVVDSMVIYFAEFTSVEVTRKDAEMLKNFITHFKILSCFSEERLLEHLDHRTHILIANIAVDSIFLGSSIEDKIFTSSAAQALEAAKQRKAKSENGEVFYFGSRTQENGRAVVEASSFSDCNNCVPQAKLAEELHKNLFFFLEKFLLQFIKQFPQLFSESRIWYRIFGQFHPVNEIVSYLKEAGLSEAKSFPDSRESNLNLYFCPEVVEQVMRRKGSVPQVSEYISRVCGMIASKEECVFLLFLTSGLDFVRGTLLRVFEALTVCMPFDYWLSQKQSSLDGFASDISRSFNSFVRLLLLDCLRQLDRPSELGPLLTFLTCLAGESFFPKVKAPDFRNVVRLVLSRAVQNHSVPEWEPLVVGAVKLFRYFLPKGPDEDPEFRPFACECIFWVSEYFKIAGPKIEEETLLNGISGLKLAVLNPSFRQQDNTIHLDNLLRFLLKVLEFADIKIREKIFAFGVALATSFPLELSEDRDSFSLVKLFNATIINSSVKDAMFVVANVQPALAIKALFVSNRQVLASQELLDFREVLKSCINPKFRFILSSIGKNFATDDELYQQNKKDFEKLCMELFLQLGNKVAKVEIMFIFNLLKSPFISKMVKQTVLSRLLKSTSNDVQDLFESVHQILKTSEFYSVCDASEQIAGLWLFLYKNIKQRSVSKTVIKSLFFLMKRQEFLKYISFDEKCIFRKLVTSVESSRQTEQNIGRKRGSFEIQEWQKAPGRTTKLNSEDFTERDDEHLNNFKNTLSKGWMVNSNSFDCFNLDSLLAYLHQRVIEINEIKTHGIFFLKVNDFYQHLEAKFEAKFSNKTISEYYFGKVGQNVTQDVFLLKSLLQDPSILSQVDSLDTIDRIAEYLLNENSTLFSKSKLEFSNNYVKNKSDILKNIFEYRMIFISFLIKEPRMLSILKKYSEIVSNLVEEFFYFLKNNMEMIFVEPVDETIIRVKRKELLELDPQNSSGFESINSFFETHELSPVNGIGLLELFLKTFNEIKLFIEKNDIQLPYSKFENLQQLSNYSIQDGKVFCKNVWNELNSGFINSYE